MNKVETIGFSPVKEKEFLGRLPRDLRRVNLERELGTQLAEDFGVIRFSNKYQFNEEGKIIDLWSGEEIVDLTIRGGVGEESESIIKIEEGLRKNPKKTWVHFSPINKELGYPENCVDFWRVVEGEVVWNRLVVKNNFEEMNEIRSFLSGEEEVRNNMELLKSPIKVDLKLAELFDLFYLKEVKNEVSLKRIEAVVSNFLEDFSGVFDEDLTKDEGLIFRLYSACFRELKYNKLIQSDYRKIDLESYMFGRMFEAKQERSYGCAATTTVGSFGEKIGYYISTDGGVKFGEIPDNYKECKQCGCWYSGNKCPFC